jgi:hypothetical protein
MTWSPVLTIGIAISGGGAVGWGSIIITMTEQALLVQDLAVMDSVVERMSSV